jgi:hypothetical protein
MVMTAATHLLTLLAGKTMHTIFKDQNWKVSSLTNTAIKIIPVKASNDITLAI